MMLTIFTPAYNRGSLLNRLYQSLMEQTDTDFEWLIVDDGSTDDTKDIVSSFCTQEKFPVTYIEQPNGGKHTAHNQAVKAAKGDLFLCIDSDDILASHAVASIRQALPSLRESDCGFMGLKQLSNGQMLCNPLPEDVCTGIYGYMNQLGCKGEYSFVFRTELLRKNLYPVIPSERFIGECVLYDLLDLKGFTVHPLNSVLTFCEYQPDGLTSHFHKLLLQNPVGYQLYHEQRMELVHTFRQRMGHAIRFQAFRRLGGGRRKYTGSHKILAMLAWIPGQFGAIYYKRKGKTNS